nr:PREDICTED: uncharacterized protein LOC108207264 [Daucus carota subsp. sativus]
MNVRYRFDLNVSLNLQETSSNVTGEVLHGENIFQEEETSDRAALVTNARHNPFDFDLNNPPGFDLNEAPSPEPPTPPHIQGDRGTTKAVANEFSVTMRTVQRIWKRARETSINGMVDVSHLKAKNCGRKRVQVDLEQLKTVPLSKRTTIRSTAYAIKVSKSTLHRETYYLFTDEEEPYRTCKSKNFVMKVMFLAAVARPRFDIHGKEIFSGKIGIYPFVTREPARRSSVNRAAGTLETKAMTSVGRDIIRSYMIDKVLPDIRAKWPYGNRVTIYIQQDNARTHLDPNDAQFCQAASQYGFDIRLMCQPSNSPDLNILDLGFFNAIQSLLYKESPKTIDELIDAVERSYQAYPPRILNRIFCTLQTCMIEILKGRGFNKYSIPHIKKNILERQGRLPKQMRCDAQLIQSVILWLSSSS